MTPQEIWLFWERPGVWGLRVGGEWWEAHTVGVAMPMSGTHRAPHPSDTVEFPRAYLCGFGYAYRDGFHVTLSDKELA